MKYKIILIFLLCMTVKAYSMNKNHFLELQVNSEDAKALIQFNDVLVFDEVNGNPVNQTLPVNHWALNGLNKLSVSVKLDPENDQPESLVNAAKGKQLVVSLLLRVVDGEDEKKYVLSRFNLEPSDEEPKKLGSASIQSLMLNSKDEYKKVDKGDVAIGRYTESMPNKKWVKFDMEFTIKTLGIPEWAYLNADVIDTKSMSDEAFYALSDELYLKYKELWSLFQAKKSGEILKLIEIRAQEYDAAYHLKSGSKLEEFKRSLNSAFDNEDLYLSDIVPTENANLRVMADGRIAKLKIAGAGEPLIYYSHKRGSFTRFYDFYFMRKNGKWIIIR